jgi:hypothetical protein
MKWYLLFLCFSFSVFSYGQDTVRYRNTSFHGSASDLILISPSYPSYGSIFPAAWLSLKSCRADSNFKALKELNFSIMVGAAASRYLFFQDEYFRNFLDKNPYHVFSKRFWGGFGINYRKQLSNKLTLDADLAPCIQIIVDRSEESKTDTSGLNSVFYENIYQGIHLNMYCKLEYKIKGNFQPFFSVSASLPLLHSIARDAGDEPYHNLFKGQLFLGLGVSYFYKTKHLTDAAEKKQLKP